MVELLKGNRSVEWNHSIVDISFLNCNWSSVRNPEGRIRLYCKGADTVLLERLHPSNQELVNITSDHLNVSMPKQFPQGWIERCCHLVLPVLKAACICLFKKFDNTCYCTCVYRYLSVLNLLLGVCSRRFADPGAGLQGPDRGRVGGVVGESPPRWQGHQVQRGATGSRVRGDRTRHDGWWLGFQHVYPWLSLSVFVFQLCLFSFLNMFLFGAMEIEPWKRELPQDKCIVQPH